MILPTRIAPELKAALVAAALGLAPAIACAKTFALVVGIDDYAHITPLGGAVNDALDISEALSGVPDTEVTVLLDGDATRAAFLSAWRAKAERSRPGDTIIVTFAGHGSNEPASAQDVDEEDGLDETILFAGFAPSGPGAGERLRDNEIAELIASVQGVTTLIVFDSCHSGTATRSSTSGLAYRFYSHGRLVDDPLPPPPPPPPSSKEVDSVFFGAVPDSAKAEELYIDGKVRGALSHAFAAGMRGGADRNADGVIEKGELEAHIRRSVRTATDGRQQPQVSPPGASSMVLTKIADMEVAERGNVFDTPFGELPKVSVLFTDLAEAPAEGSISGVELVSSAADAELIVDLAAREVRSSLGDVVAYLESTNQLDVIEVLKSTADKFRFVDAVKERATVSDIEISFPSGDELYYSDDRLTLFVENRAFRYATIFNLPSNGRVEWFYPRNPALDPTTPFRHPLEVDPEQLIRLDFVVSPPFGADHLFVIETEEDVPAVRRAVRRHHNSQNIRPLWVDLMAALEGRRYHVAVHPFFTISD